MSDIYEYIGDVPNPYDSKFSYEETLAQKRNNFEPIIGGGFLPGGSNSNHHRVDNNALSSIDCHDTLVYCNPDPSSENFIAQCQVCNTIGGGICLEASHLPGILTSPKNTTIREVIDTSTAAAEKVGLCVPKGRRDHEFKHYINRYTTDIVVGVIGDYNHIHDDNGLPVEQTIVTKTTSCKDDRIVRKNTHYVRADPLAASFMNCDEIVLCGGEGVGYPLHPLKKTFVRSVDDIDFDIIAEANLLTCGCAEGYTEIRDETTHHLPTCQKGGGGGWRRPGQRGLAAAVCPVAYIDGITGIVRCVCNPATQVSLFEVVDSVTRGGLTTDYDMDTVQALTVFKDELLDGLDACLPKPGVDPRVSAFGYGFAAHVFYDDDNDEASSFRLGDNMGGHLMTGGLVRRGGVTSGGDWLSAVDDDRENENKRASYSIGGISPFLGTGGVPAHIWGGDVWNDNNIIVGSSPDKDRIAIVHPNGSLKMVPPSTTGIPGVGVSLEHAVGLVASAGRYYPGGVYRRGGELSTKDCGVNRESCFLEKVTDMDKNNPLTQMMSTNDPGVCASAFIVPFFHDKCRTDYEKNPEAARLPREAPTQRLKGLTGHYHSRPLAMAMGYTPIERLFRYFCSTCTRRKNLAFPDKFISMFPHMIQGNVSTEDDWQRLFSSTGQREGDNNEFSVDLLGGLFIQPTTVSGSGTSSLNTKWTEEMISTNLPCLIDHYEIDDGRAYSVGVDHDDENSKVKYVRYPTAQNLVANQTGQYTGFSLTGGKENSGYSHTRESPYCFVDAAVFGAENVIWNNAGFTTLALPQDVPVAILPEEMRFSRRNDSFGLTKASLADFKNKYARFEGELFDLSLGANDNVYNPPALKKKKKRDETSSSSAAAVPSKSINDWFPFEHELFDLTLRTSNDLLNKNNEEKKKKATTVTTGTIVDDFPSKYINDDWVPGRADGLVPSLTLTESFFRMRPLCSRYLFSNKPAVLFQDWGSNPHTSGDLFQGIASAPCSKYELGGYMSYPSSGSLNQYVTILSPRSFGEFGHIDDDSLTESKLLEAIKALSESNPKDTQSYLMAVAANQKCNCLTDIFCSTNNNNNNNDTGVVAATPSRGNRFAPYLFCRSTPKHHLPLMYALMRLENRDPFIVEAITKGGVFNLLQNKFTANRALPVAANRFTATRNNAAFTRFFAREPIVPYDRVTPLSTDPSSSSLPVDYHDDAILSRDDFEYNVPVGKPQYLLFRNTNGHLRYKRIVDFYESSCRVSPNTICSDTFSAWHEGPGGIVAMYGTPVMGNPRTMTTTTAKNFPMRMIHTYNINTPHMSGFQCGQTPAEGMLTRGVEAWYHPFTKPPLGDNVTTTLEGIRARTEEPFERLAVRGFRKVDKSLLTKYSLLSHYGIDGLVSFAYADREARRPTSMASGSARYPFACQSDRVPFPLTMHMTIQTRALRDMNVNNQTSYKLEFEERNSILHDNNEEEEENISSNITKKGVEGCSEPEERKE